MSRRDISKREKLRAEERELDKQLKDAGMDMPGMSYEEKREIFSMLEESRKLAQEEENQRKQLQEKEEQILHETLNKSSHNVDMDEVRVADDQKGTADTKNAVSVVPDAGQVCDTDCISSSGSSTPDLFPLPSESPSKARMNQYQSPVRSSGNSLAHVQSPRHSEDMFLFSQTSTKLGVDENVIRDCIETIKVSESEDEDEDMSCTPVRNTPSSPQALSCTPAKTRTPVKQMQSDITSSAEKTRNSPCGNVSAVKPRPSLRRYQSDNVVSAPSPRTQRSEDEEVKSSSQPISLDVKQSPLSMLMERMDGDSLISPVIGQRKVVTSSDKLSSAKNKVTSIQDAEISNSLSVKPFRMTSPDLISDDDANMAEIHSSTEPQHVAKEEEEAHSSSELKILNGDVVRNKVMKRKVEALDDEVSSKMEIVEQLTTSADRVTLRKSPKLSKNPTFMGLSLSESDDDQIVQKKKDGKKHIDVFFTIEGEDISLKRKTGRSEAPKKVYFKNTNESVKYAYERILDLINKSFSDLERYQRTLVRRMKWPDPIKVDRRVKDSLDHPKSSSRRLMELPPMTIDAESSRMTTRHSQQKTSGVAEEDISLSEESLPEMLTDGEWFDARKKNANKRRSIHSGMSRRQAKFTSTVGTAAVSSVNVLHESDSEDFDFSTSIVTRLSPVVKQKGIATAGKESNDKNNRITSLSVIEENRTNFDFGDILADSEECESTVGGKDNAASSKEKPVASTSSLSGIGNDSQPSTSGLKYPNKRPRKTFSLTIDSDEELVQNSEASSTSIDRLGASLVARSSHTVQSTTKEEKSRIVTTSESKYISQRKKETVVFVSSFEDDAVVKDNSDEDLCVIDSSSRPVASTSRRGRGNPVQLKPAPIRLKSKRGRGREKTTMADGSQRNEDADSQPPSTSEFPQQMPRSAKVTEKTAEEETVVCPLCQESFLITVIEAHASNCGEPTAEMNTQLPPVKRRREQQDAPGSSEDDIGRRRRERTPPNFARCGHCRGVFKEGDTYLVHVQECQRSLVESGTMASPSSRTPIRGRRSPAPSASSSSNHMRMAQPSSVFERLEGESL